MSKERSSAFFDAVFAIVLTILVLDLQKPTTLTWESLFNLKESYLAYAISFFWLGTMWINIHNEFEYIKNVSIKTIWSELVLLFFTSFFPYTTSLVSTNFHNNISQIIYGLIVLLVTLSFIIMFRFLREDNINNKEYIKYIENRNSMGLWIKYDVIIKIIGLLLSITIFPEAMLLSVLITLIVFVIPKQIGIY